MRGEKIRPNDGYESVNLSPAEKAGLKPEEVVKLKPKKSKEAALESVEDQLNKAKSVAVEDDFSEDEVTKEYEKPLVTAKGFLTPEGHKANSRKRVENSRRAAKPSQDTKDVLQMVKDISTPTGEALAEVRELSGSYNDPEVVAQRARDKEDLEQVKAELTGSKQDLANEAAEVADLKKIRKSILNESTDVEKLDAEIKAGFKSADNQSVARPKARAVKEKVGLVREVKPESEKVKNAKAFAENAIQAYSKLFIEYYPDTVNKIYEGKKESSDRVGAFDLVAITPPPLRAIFTAKGRRLRDVYGQVQKAIEKYNDEVEAS